MSKEMSKEFWKLDDAECDPYAPSPWFTDDPEEAMLYGCFRVFIPKMPASRLQPARRYAEKRHEEK